LGLNLIPSWALGLILFAGVILAYQPAWTLDSSGMMMSMYRNKLLTAPDGLVSNLVLYRSPSTYFALVYTTVFPDSNARLWGNLNPAGYHWIKHSPACQPTRLIALAAPAAF